MRVLLTSGHPGDAIESRLPPGAKVLPKPYTIDLLGAAVRRLLDEPTSSAS